VFLALLEVLGFRRRNSHNRCRLVAIDADDMDMVAFSLEQFGDTPGQIATRRGRHLLFRDPGYDFRGIVTLRHLGFNIDVKHGRSIAVAPPSIHPSDPSFAYQFVDCDESVILSADLPLFPIRKLFRLFEIATRAHAAGRDSVHTAPELYPGGVEAMRTRWGGK
jgi:hypothetical protein